MFAAGEYTACVGTPKVEIRMVRRNKALLHAFGCIGEVTRTPSGQFVPPSTASVSAVSNRVLANPTWLDPVRATVTFGPRLALVTSAH